MWCRLFDCLNFHILANADLMWFLRKRSNVTPYLPKLADEEDKHEPEERGCSSCAHQNDDLNIWLPFISWREKNCRKLPDHFGKNIYFSWSHNLSHYIAWDLWRIGIKRKQSATYLQTDSLFLDWRCQDFYYLSMSLRNCIQRGSGNTHWCLFLVCLGHAYHAFSYSVFFQTLFSNYPCRHYVS